MKTARQYLLEEFSQVRNPGLDQYQWIGGSGDCHDSACLDQGLAEFEVEKVSEYRMTRHRVGLGLAKLSGLAPQQIRSLSNSTRAGRYFSRQGVLILHEAMMLSGFIIIASERVCGSGW